MQINADLDVILKNATFLQIFFIFWGWNVFLENKEHFEHLNVFRRKLLLQKYILLFQPKSDERNNHEVAGEKGFVTNELFVRSDVAIQAGLIQKQWLIVHRICFSLLEVI